MLSQAILEGIILAGETGRSPAGEVNKHKQTKINNNTKTHKRKKTQRYKQTNRENDWAQPPQEKLMRDRLEQKNAKLMERMQKLMMADPPSPPLPPSRSACSASRLAPRFGGSGLRVAVPLWLSHFGPAHSAGPGMLRRKVVPSGKKTTKEADDGRSSKSYAPTPPFIFLGARV